MEQSLIQTLNSQTKNMQVDVRVITLNDNLHHPYFTSIDISKDNLSPIGIGKIITVYSSDILKYWTNYTGIVVISFNMKESKNINTNSSNFTKTYGLPERLENNEYNYSLISKVSKIKHKGKQITIYLEDLGWKFLQKVPKEFRETYIAGQSLDKAFQAICEFLGVDFAYSIKDLQEYNFGADGYSIEKEGEVIEIVETMLSKLKTQEEEEEENNPLDQEDYENSSLIEFDNENKNNEDYVRNDKQNNRQISEPTEEEKVVEEYEEEFNQKILDLFIGNTFYESKLTSNIMSYDSITITPTSNSDTNINNNENSMTGVEIGESNDDQDNETNSPFLDITGGLQLSKNDHGKKALNMSYIKTLTTTEAAELAKKTNVYDNKTIKRLRRRALGAYW